MKRHIIEAFIFGFACVAPSSLHAQAVGPSADSTAIREVLAAIDRANVAAAKGDSATMRRFMADDYVTITSAGTFGYKEQALARYGGGEIRVISDSYSNSRVRVFGETAVITHVWHVVFANSAAPRDLAQTQIMTKRDGHWLIVGSQSTPIQAPAAARSPAKPPAAMANDPFAGDFMLVSDTVRIGPSAKFTRAKLHVERDSTWVTKTLTFLDDQGAQAPFTYRMQEDGADYPGLAGNPNTMSIQRTGLRSVRQVEKHNGRPVARYEELLSPDGDTLTVSHTLVDEASGATRAIRLEVFRRVR